ncbi:hypothetical protein SAMN05443247_06616 [Bradyrhizobium erythrophlei]|nr:hypothetical protein SAMN05443247_06616 [Bradyrhizobium erythrophlei]
MPPDMEIAAALAAAYAIRMTLGMQWADLALLGLIWLCLGIFSHARLLHSWGWSLPALLESQLWGDRDGADHHRKWLWRIDSRRRWCVFLIELG